MGIMAKDTGTSMRPITLASAPILLILATQCHAQVFGHFVLYCVFLIRMCVDVYGPLCMA